MFQGPFIGALLSERVSWRWCFWVMVPPGAAAALGIYLFLPLRGVKSNAKEKLKKIDYYGAILSLAATIFILIPLSSGGTIFAWNSAIVITLLVLGAVLVAAFLLVEWKVAPLPVMPRERPWPTASATYSVQADTPLFCDSPPMDIPHDCHRHRDHLPLGNGPLHQHLHAAAVPASAPRNDTRTIGSIPARPSIDSDVQLTRRRPSHHAHKDGSPADPDRFRHLAHWHRAGDDVQSHYTNSQDRWVPSHSGIRRWPGSPDE